jgi:hypothetical protein
MLTVVGDSHVFALNAALAKLPPEEREKLGEVACGVLMWGFHALQPFFEENTAGLRFLGEAGEKFASVTGGPNRIADDDPRLFGLSFGFHTAVMAREICWETHGLFENSAKQFVSQAVFRACVLHETRHVLAFVDALIRRRVRCFMLTPPPVRRRFAENYAHHMAPAELARFQHRYWAIMAAEFARRQIGVLRPPDAAVADGYLLADFDSPNPDDLHHANPAYGRLVWGQIGQTWLG